MSVKFVNKWNCKKHKYEPYIVRDSWNITTYETDMDKIINCADCGKKLLVGNSYTSKLIQSALGFGYCVCRECNKKEWEEYLKYKED